MSTKKLSLAITTMLPLLLIGCGGGGGSSDSSSGSHIPQDNLDNGTRYYALDYEVNTSTTGNIGDDNLTFEYFEILNKQFKNSSPSNFLDGYVLTAGKLYTPRDLAKNTVTLNSLTSWTSHLIGDVKTDIKLEKVNLAGKNVFDTILPGYRRLGFDDQSTYFEAKQLQSAAGNATFPQGSTCYRVVSKKNNQEFFNFNTDEVYNQDFADFDTDNQNYVDYLNKTYKLLGLNFRYVSGIWQNIPWTSIYEIGSGEGDDDSVAVNFQNKTYLAEYNSNIEWTVGKEIKQWEHLLTKAVTSAQEREAQLHLENLKNGCTFFNATAVNTLVSYRQIDWNH